MSYISLFLPLRIGSNGSLNTLCEWFDSIINACHDIKNIEVIAKLDDCDPSLNDILKNFESYSTKITIKYLVSPRGRGYNDLSKAYMDLLFLLDNDSQMIMAGSVDMRVSGRNIDMVLLESAKKYDDGIFVCHFCNSNIKDINVAAQEPDPFPVWSRKWVEIVGHFGYNALNDGYTNMVECFLVSDWAIDRRITLTDRGMIKEMNGYGPESVQWQGIRRTIMEQHISETGITLARQAAKNLAFNIINPLTRDHYITLLQQATLNTYDELCIISFRAKAQAQARRKARRYMRRIMILTIAVLTFFVIIYANK